ncbi:MAG: hypothetical protein KAJ24_04315 [Candidatus Aenigmarchaeota archaeon]|nr:hypothetical protein [Candidatus Aenigmarchaeota archaeon]
MFENSKTDTEKRISSLSDELIDIKNQKKLAELDFEKRVVLLEDAVNTINKTVGSAKNLKDMKENLEHVIDVQSKIREVEDREIIDRLESMQAKDTLNLLDDNVETISKKLELLSDAVKTLGERTHNAGKSQKEEIVQKIGLGSKDLDLLRSEILAVRTGKADAQSIEALESKYESMKNSFLEIDKNFAELASSARGALKKRDKDIESIQKKIEELEEVPVKTKQISSRVDSLNEAGKKMETLLTSLRNQISLAEKNIKPLQAGQELAKKAFAETNKVKKGLDETKTSFSESLNDIDTKIDNIHASAQKEFDKKSNDIEFLQNKISTLETLSVDEALLSSRVDVLSEADKKKETLLTSLQNQISLAEENVKPLQAGQELAKKAFAETNKVKKGLDETKNNFMNSLEKQSKEYKNALEKSRIFAKKEYGDIQNAHSAVKKEYAKIKENFDELNWSLEKRVSESANNVLEKQTRLQKESLEALKNTTRRVEVRSKEIEQVMEKRNSEYKKVCSVLKESEVLNLINQIEHIKKTEENIKNDISSEISTMAKGLVEEELKDVTGNLKKIIDFTRKSQVKQEDVEHIVENRISSLTADYNKFGKALGTLQRIVQQEHVNISQNVHSKLDTEMSTVKDEIEDLREDIELLKGLRGDLVEDINKIIAGYEDKNKTRTVEKLEHTAEFEAERIDRLEETVNKKLAEHIKQIEQMEPKHTGEQEVSAHIETKLSIIDRENQSLREELEELKGAYFQIMKLQQNAPIIIE